MNEHTDAAASSDESGSMTAQTSVSLPDPYTGHITLDVKADPNGEPLDELDFLQACLWLAGSIAAHMEKMRTEAEEAAQTDEQTERTDIVFNDLLGGPNANN